MEILVQYTTLSHADYENLRFLLLKQLEGNELRPCYDTHVPAIPSIGIGINLPDASRAGADATGLGIDLDDPDDQVTWNAILTTITGPVTTNSQLQQALYAEMARRGSPQRALRPDRAI